MSTNLERGFGIRQANPLDKAGVFSARAPARAYRADNPCVKIPEKMGDRVDWLIGRLGLDNKQFAHLLDVGADMVSAYLVDKHRPSRRRLARLAHQIGYPEPENMVSFILNGERLQHPVKPQSPNPKSEPSEDRDSNVDLRPSTGASGHDPLVGPSGTPGHINEVDAMEPEEALMLAGQQLLDNAIIMQRLKRERAEQKKEIAQLQAEKEELQAQINSMKARRTAAGNSGAGR